MKINWLHVVNSVAGAAAMVGGLNPALFGPYAAQAALAIGGATIVANVLHAFLDGQKTPSTLPPPSSGTVAKLHWLTLLASLVMVLMITACASVQSFLGSPTGQTVVVAGVQVAVTTAEQRGVTAAQINSVAKAVLAADSGLTVSLTTLTATVNSAAQKAGVPPGDIVAFQVLETAFDAYLVAKYGTNSTVTNVQADIATFANAVIADTGG